MNLFSRIINKSKPTSTAEVLASEAKAAVPGPSSPAWVPTEEVFEAFNEVMGPVGASMEEIVFHDCRIGHLVELAPAGTTADCIANIALDENKTNIISVVTLAAVTKGQALARMKGVADPDRELTLEEVAARCRIFWPVARQMLVERLAKRIEPILAEREAATLT